MPFKVVTLDQARRHLAAGPRRFEEIYPGVFLLAIGLLRARQIDPPNDGERGGTREYPALDLERTLSMSFGERLTHAMQDHPLAGCSFWLPWELAGQEQTVGRRVGSDLTVPDQSVSEHHCTVNLPQTRDRLIVIDLDSTNGTSIDLRRLAPGEPGELPDEAILTVGRYGFQLLCAATLHRALLELVRPA